MAKNGEGRIAGGPPAQPFHNQNARLLDDVRIRAGIPLNQDFGLLVRPELVPVFLVDADAAPIPRNQGIAFVNVAANAGFRSEFHVSISVLDRNMILEFTVDLVAAAAIAIECLLAPTGLAGFTQQTITRYSDLRYDPIGLASGVFIATKNTAAATGTGNSLGTISLAAGQILSVGPFWLDGARVNLPAGRTQVLFHPNADNAAINAVVRWRVLQRQPT